MFDYLEGKIAEKKPIYVVIDVNGVGYKIRIPISTYDKIKNSERTKLLTYLKVSEDEIKIYGFATEQERQVFMQLINSINRLGPSKAIAILSNVVGIDELITAIENEDVDFLRKIKGVGNKIANRLIVELKGKLPYSAGTKESDKDNSLSIIRDAVQALVSLGYQGDKVEEVIRKVKSQMSSNIKLEDLIKKCLQIIS